MDAGEEKTHRPVRNKKYNRRIYGEEKRPCKRLFTPEIKRFLKDWLIRRRENPYPNRDEKKMLALQTGLTYIQVCNWFANWRRKLKNAHMGKDLTAHAQHHQHTWSDLIRTYNAHVHGNVEHFSICSDDSIWQEPTEPDQDGCGSTTFEGNNNFGEDKVDQCYFVSSTTPEEPGGDTFATGSSTLQAHNNQQLSSSKYKSHMMEKYLQDCHYQKPTADEETATKKSGSEPSEDSSVMISRWLESAANFRPSQGSYLDWAAKQKRKKTSHSSGQCSRTQKASLPIMHGREELDAAEALTTLANSSRYKTQMFIQQTF